MWLLPDWIDAYKHEGRDRFIHTVESATMADLKRFQRMNLDDESFTSDSDERRTLQLEEFGPGARRFGPRITFFFHLSTVPFTSGLLFRVSVCTLCNNIE